MKTENIFKIVWGDNSLDEYWVGSTYVGHEVSNYFYVKTNAASAIEIESAYNAGSALVGFDVKKCWITPEDMENLKRHGVNTLSLPNGKEWALEELDDDEGDRIWYYDYFYVWLNLTCIGNPNLLFTVEEHRYDLIDIQGYGLCEERKNAGEKSFTFIAQNESDLALSDKSEKIYHFRWGPINRSNLRIFDAFLLSNIQSVDGILESYRRGVAIIGFDIQASLSNWSLPPLHEIDTISANDLSKIREAAKSREAVKPEDFIFEECGILEDGASDFWDVPWKLYRPDETRSPSEMSDRLHISPGEYLLLWRATAYVGNPNLTMKAHMDETREIYIGGYGAFPDSE